MSTLKVNNIGKTSGSTQDTMEGRIKAWSKCRQDGGFLVRDSFNASSVTDNGTGAQTHNFSTNMSNAHYSVGGTADRRSGVRTSHFSLEYSVPPTTSSCRYEARDGSGGANKDCLNHCVMMVGDLS